MTALLPPAGAPLVRPGDYALVWEETFEGGTMPAPARWRYDTSRNRAGWYNRELQYYARARPRNARLEGGSLIVEAHAEDLSGAGLGDWGGQRYSSARLTTRGLAAWRHGFFEIRARLPCVRGAWPAIWLHPVRQESRWDGGEIDIAEVVGHEPGAVHHSVHTADRNFRAGNHQTAATRLRPCEAFHEYQLHWTRERIVIGVDGRVGFSAPASGFDRAMALILNVAVGGTWAGAQGIDDGAFPARLEIESVRVWQEKEG